MSKPINNVFVLCTGRCGSVTFSKACGHFSNFTVGHESRSKIGGAARTQYPQAHIEIDNRLTWFLGTLEARYGDSALYVHLTRNRDEVANSFNRRWHMRGSIVRGYCDHILSASVKDPLAACYDYIYTVESNISAFLRNKTQVLHFDIADYRSKFPEFIDRISAKGNLEQSMSEWTKQYNRSA